MLDECVTIDACDTYDLDVRVFRLIDRIDQGLSIITANVGVYNHVFAVWFESLGLLFSDVHYISLVL